jgi:hypothetical protein
MSYTPVLHPSSAFSDWNSWQIHVTECYIPILSTGTTYLYDKPRIHVCDNVSGQIFEQAHAKTYNLAYATSIDQTHISAIWSGSTLLVIILFATSRYSNKLCWHCACTGWLVVLSFQKAFYHIYMYIYRVQHAHDCYNCSSFLFQTRMRLYPLL